MILADKLIRDHTLTRTEYIELLSARSCGRKRSVSENSITEIRSLQEV